MIITRLNNYCLTYRTRTIKYDGNANEYAHFEIVERGSVYFGIIDEIFDLARTISARTILNKQVYVVDTSLTVCVL